VQKELLSKLNFVLSIPEADIDRIMGSQLRTQISEQKMTFDAIDPDTLTMRGRSALGTVSRVLSAILKHDSIPFKATQDLVDSLYPLGQSDITELPMDPADTKLFRLINGLESITLPDYDIELILETIAAEGGKLAPKAQAYLEADVRMKQVPDGAEDRFAQMAEQDPSPDEGEITVGPLSRA